MLYKFKSRATADLIMLEPDGRRILEIIGKSPEPVGIITVAQIPAALEALKAAVAEDQAWHAQQHPKEDAEPLEDEEGEPVRPTPLHVRAVPVLEMLRQCLAEGCDIVWGV